MSKEFLPLLKPKADRVINVNDPWWKNKRIPVHVYVMQAMERAGYELRNIIIWDRRDLKQAQLQSPLFKSLSADTRELLADSIHRKNSLLSVRKAFHPR